MEVRIEVVGSLPPAKGEAKSMLAQGHTQQERVRRLLEAASLSMADRHCLAGDIELDVTVIAPRGRQLPDATNMLGGIGDVLQARVTGAVVDHLGVLAQVACFHDDAQIQQVQYRRLDGDQPRYTVVIRPLAH
jgi:Holliday junction resolvase RusA-like endonuclease